MFTRGITYQTIRQKSLGAPIMSCLLLTLALSLLFFSFPEIDLAIARLFFEPDQGFPAARVAILQDFRYLASHLAVALPLVLTLGIWLKLAYPSKPCLLPPRLSLYFMSLFLAGPALLVNGILKVFWGRPRPVNVDEFGGLWTFLPAWVMGTDGVNRSFSSGEAATAACLLPLLLFIPREWRWQIGTLLAIFVAAVGLNRMAFGAHFLSDVTISIGLMLTLAAALHHLFFVRYAEALSDEALEAKLTALGHRCAADRAALARLIGRALGSYRAPPAPASPLREPSCETLASGQKGRPPLPDRLSEAR